jgi:hypothetical protein
MSDYLTVSQAAARLGISERQARRYAGRLAPDDRREAGHEAGHMTGALVRLEAMQSEREKAAKRIKTDVGPDVVKHEAGRNDRTPDTQSGEVLALLKSENAFLRGMLEARDRDAAELRAALRKALEAMPKALTDGSTPNAENIGREDAPQAPIIRSGDVAPAPQKQGVQHGAKLRKLTTWQRVAARILGIR